MIARIFARLSRKQPPPVTDNREERRMFPDLDVMIAKRALRLHNRSADGAAKYARVQAILARGRD
jgi:hypothetical protein